VLGKQFKTLQRTVVHSKHINYSPNDKAPHSVRLETSTFLVFTLPARWNTIPLSIAHYSIFCILSSLEIGCSTGKCLNHQGPFLGFVKDHVYIIVSARVCNWVKVWMLQQRTAHTGKVPSKVRTWMLQQWTAHTGKVPSKVRTWMLQQSTALR
jgi:hypothetical protein